MTEKATEVESMTEEASDINKNKAIGGYARAQVLSPEERKAIARKGALARWNADVPQATHEGELKIGRSVISAAVLPSGKRLLSQSSFLLAIGRSRTPKAGTGAMSNVDGLPFFLQAEQLKPFISEELRQSTAPVFFRNSKGQRSIGYDALLLPMVCEVYLAFRDHCLEQSGQIPRNYKHIIKACDLLMQGLARVGIIALVDEATGFQDVRAKEALAKILEQFIAKELRPYVKTFPLDFFRELCRLRRITFREDMKLPSYFGKLINNLVYCRLAPGVLEELRTKNPVVSNGRRKNKHYQWLTENIGHPKLLQLLGSEVTLMRMATEWDEFTKLVDKFHPVYKPLPLFDWASEREAR